MLDFTTTQRTLDIQLPIGFIHVLPPKKKQIKIVAKLSSLAESLTKMDEEAISEMYVCIADLMSNNTEKKEIAVDDIEDVLDFAMITEFIGEYAEIMNGAIAGKN